MSDFWVGQVVSFAGTLLATLLGVFGGYLAAARLARKQKTEETIAAMDAHLRLFYEECKANLKLMDQLVVYLKDDRKIEKLFDPAEITSRHLRSIAWESLLRAGLYSALRTENQQLFSEADFQVRKVALDVQAVVAEWRTGLSWPHNTQLQVRELFEEKQQLIRMSLEYARPPLEAAIHHLEQGGRPA